MKLIRTQYFCGIQSFVPRLSSHYFILNIVYYIFGMFNFLFIFPDYFGQHHHNFALLLFLDCIPKAYVDLPCNVESKWLYCSVVVLVFGCSVATPGEAGRLPAATAQRCYLGSHFILDTFIYGRSLSGGITP